MQSQNNGFGSGERGKSSSRDRKGEVPECIFKDSSKECQLQSDWYFYGLAEWTFMTKNIVIQKNKYLKYGIHLPNMKFLFIYSSFVIH